MSGASQTGEASCPQQGDVKALSVDAGTYGSDCQAHLLEQYKLAVEMADRISTRRQEVNNYFLGISSAIVAFTVLFSGPSQAAGAPTLHPAGVIALAVAGIAICALWFLLLKSFRTLNSAKYKVITEIERHLPARPYASEWEILSFGVTSKHRTLTQTEKGVPLVFGLLYLTMGGLAVLQQFGLM